MAADIEIHRRFSSRLTRSEAKKAVRAVEATLKKEYSLKVHWTDEFEAEVSGSSVEGKLKIGKGAIDINATLTGFLASMFRDTISDAIKQKLDRSLGFSTD